MREEAKRIAKAIYPDKYKDVGGGLMVDQNASLRNCAEEVASHMLESLRSEETAVNVMHAFFRREHGREPTGDEKLFLPAQMSTALMAIKFD